MLSTQYFYIKQDYKYWAAKSLANMSSLLKEKLIIDLPIINFIKVSYHYLPASVVTHCLPCVNNFFFKILPNLECSTCIKRNQKCNEVFLLKYLLLGI